MAPVSGRRLTPAPPHSGRITMGAGIKTGAILALAVFQAIFPASVSRASAFENQNSARSRLDLMADFDQGARAFRRDLEKIPGRAQKIESLEQLRKTVRELKQAGNSVSDPALWEQYCDAVLGILNDTETQVKRFSWPAAQKSFARVQNLRDQMFADSGMGPWDRFRLWIKRVF